MKKQGRLKALIPSHNTASLKVVVKIGGSTLGSNDTTLQDLVSLQRQGVVPIVVHGGGAVITQWLDKHGVPSRFVQGLRVTEAESLQVATAVLAGLINKELVAGLLALGGKAVGLSGVDGALIEGRIRDPELGFVGAVTAVNLAPLEALRTGGYIAVIAPLGFNATRNGSEGPMLLNFNADTVAGEIAAVMAADKLVFLTDVPGVQDRQGQLLSAIPPEHAHLLIQDGAVSGGMIPKVEACLRAAARGTESWIIDGRVEHMLLSALFTSSPIGTRVGNRQGGS